MSNADHSALSRCVGNVDVFASERWGQGSYVHRGAGSFSDLLTLQDFDGLVASSLPTSVVDVIIGGEAIDKGSLRVEDKDRGAGVQHAIDPFKVSGAYQNGATVALRSLHHLWPALGRFTAELEQSTGLRNYAQAFLTPPGGRGLRAHVDNHDVFVMQVEGRRDWWAEDIGHVTLEPGDVLYMPIATRHRARSFDEPSIHISIAIIAETYRSLIDRLLSFRTSWLDEALPLPIAPDPGQVASKLKEKVDAVGSHLAAIDFDDAARRQLARRVSALPSGRGHLANAVLASMIDDNTMLEPRTSDAMDVRPGYGGQVILSTSELMISLPAEYERTLEHIAEAGSFRVGILTDLPSRRRGELAEQLVRYGFHTVCAWCRPQTVE